MPIFAAYPRAAGDPGHAQAGAGPPALTATQTLCSAASYPSRKAARLGECEPGPPMTLGNVARLSRANGSHS
jgi:hypothetical protein